MDDLHARQRKWLVGTGRGKSGDSRMLWDFYAPRLIAYARTILASQGAQASAEDVVQIAMCKVLKTSPRKLKRIQAVGPWLYTIVRTSALNHMRGERREIARRAHASTPKLATPPSSHELLRKAVEGLPSDEGEVVSLRHAGGLTFDQIAEVLQIPRSTAASRHARALERLRDRLTETDEQDDPKLRIVGGS